MLYDTSKRLPAVNYYLLDVAAALYPPLNVNTLHSQRVAKYNKTESQNLRDLKQTAKGLLKFQFKLGYIEEHLFVIVSVNFYKNASFAVDV